MLSNKSMRIAGVAMLGTVAFLGTNAANAQINLTPGDDQTGMGLVFAKETVVKTGMIAEDGVNYYLLPNIGTDGKVVAELGVSAVTTDRVLVEYTLSGMVFGAPLTSGSLKLGSNGSGSRQKLSGGSPGDNTVLFSVAGSSFESTKAAELTARFAISAGGVGSIAMKVTNVTLASVLGADSPAATKTVAYSGAIRLMNALTEKPEPMDATATVASSFQKFAASGVGEDDVTVATVGSFMVSVVDPKLRVANAVSGEVKELKDIVTANTANEADRNYVTFTGDFSFASKVSLGTGNACPGAADAADLRMMDDDMMVMDNTKPTALPPAARTFLCIMVDEEDPDLWSDDMPLDIPETAAYTMTTTYAGLDTAAMPTMGTTRELGMVVRDGTTVRLPYLTTNAKYNQRIHIVNRGGMAKYSMTFASGAVGGADANGTLEANSTTVLSLRTDDVVTISSGGSTSGTLIIEARSTNVDVVTNQVNTELGTSDTVLYQ